ncbi:saccharopine dehydrogenase [Umbelopsis sp. AD052]|nr:saccharopine dehydrogenase [Umbelopsis sp. AD052]
MSSDRKYDLVVYGATGFTGAYTAEYIAKLHDKNLKWALAGRSIPKLEKVRNTLAAIDEQLKNLDLLVVDSFNPDSLDEAFKQAKVIISTVGPFEKYGTPVVESCIRQGTHYVDITGEFTWAKTIIDKYHDAAVENGTIIVPFCGFDCVPSDMGAYMVVNYIRKKFGLDTSDVKLSVKRLRGGASGGTIQTSLNILRHEKAGEAQDPYYLSPFVGIDKFRIPWMRWDADFKKWQAYYIMSMVNELVVRRSYGISTTRGSTYGKTFKYRESMSFPFLGAFAMTFIAVGILPWLGMLFKLSPIYRLVSSLLPQGGTGPSREAIIKGSYELELIGTAETEPYENPIRVRGIVRGRMDPGYGDTCRMVAESALSIVYGYDKLPGKAGGILTPASAFGDVLLTRLRDEGGMDFLIEQIE